MSEPLPGIGGHAWAWLALAGFGAYHGVNPAMGWLFAAGNGLQARRTAAVFSALPPIALGHFLAIAAALLPFALLGAYFGGLNALRFACGVLLIVLGAYKLARPRHPRLLARVGPRHLALWSFLAATAHGAGLMLVPVWFGLLPAPAAHRAGHALGLGIGVGSALAAAAVHTAAMLTVAGLIAWLVYRYLGLRLLSRAWFNFDLLWAAVLVLTGGLALALSSA